MIACAVQRTALTVSPHKGGQEQRKHHAEEAEAKYEQPEAPRAVCGVEGDEPQEIYSRRCCTESV